MRARILLLAVLLTPGVVLAADPSETTNRVVIDEIVARVNNQIITLSDLERSRNILRQELQQAHSGAALEQKYSEEEVNLLRDLIDQALLVQRGTDMGLSVEADVIKRLDRVRADAGLKSLEELERALAAQGIDYQDYRQRIRDQILTQQVIQRQVAGRVLIDSDELRQYYDEHQEELRKPERYRLREILVSTEGYRQDQLPEREERVRELLAKIRQGEEFAELARTYSDAPTAEDGGELGYFEPNRLAPRIREAIGHLREGGVCDPMRTPEGWLILQLVEHIPEGIPPFERAESELMQKLYFDQVQPALREFLSELRRDAFVYVKSGYVDSGAVEEPAKPVRRGRRLRSLRDKKND